MCIRDRIYTTNTYTTEQKAKEALLAAFDSKASLSGVRATAVGTVEALKACLLYTSRSGGMRPRDSDFKTGPLGDHCFFYHIAE